MSDDGYCNNPECDCGLPHEPWPPGSALSKVSIETSGPVRAAEAWARGRRLMASCDTELAVEAFMAGVQWQARMQQELRLAMQEAARQDQG